MIDPEMIPAAALEAAARGVYEAERPDIETLSWENIGEWRREYFRKIARAACLAMLEAWPGMHSGPSPADARRKSIILPLTQENSDERE